MADPNTQIDWWIAQAWQEAQGGADSDALVAWLHENGLTAVSSYTILQAALSCSSEEAKQMVFGHPAWAGADAEADLSGAEYTSDTLEPEPEPDATFGLDDWADEIEEDEPVYGEPGYEPPPSATPSRPSASDGETPPQRKFLLDAYAELEAEEGDAGEEIVQHEETGAGDAPSFASEDSYQDSEPEPVAEMEPEESPPVESEYFDEDEDEQEIDADQVFEIEPEWEAEPESSEPAPIASMVPPPNPSPRPEPEPSPTAKFAEVAPSPTATVAEEPVSTPSPAPAGPPILRMPPATPAERRATFAAAFGKKPTAAPGQSAASAGTATDSADGGPPSNDLGPAAHAETAPAQIPADSPQPAPAAAPMPPPLTLEPLPEFTAPPPVTPAEPLFTATSPREPMAAPPLFPPRSDQPAPEDLSEASPADDNAAASEEQMQAVAQFSDSEPEPVEEEVAESGDPIAVPDNIGDFEDLPPETVADEPPFVEAQDDEPSDDELDVEPAAVEEDGDADQQAFEEDELPEIDWEEELPDFEIEEPEDPAALDNGANGEVNDNPELDEAAEHPRKRLLLDPSEEEAEKPGAADGPEDLSEAAKRLGINFRGADATEAGIDPEMSKAAKELGISFRDEGGGPDPNDDEAALEAQKLGISFRDETATGNPPKPLIAKYLPMFLGLIVIFFLLLIAATFAGDIIGWLKS